MTLLYSFSRRSILSMHFKILSIQLRNIVRFIRSGFVQLLLVRKGRSPVVARHVRFLLDHGCVKSPLEQLLVLFAHVQVILQKRLFHIDHSLLRLGILFDAKRHLDRRYLTVDATTVAQVVKEMHKSCMAHDQVTVVFERQLFGVLVLAQRRLAELASVRFAHGKSLAQRRVVACEKWLRFQSDRGKNYFVFRDKLIQVFFLIILP